MTVVIKTKAELEQEALEAWRDSAEVTPYQAKVALLTGRAKATDTWVRTGQYQPQSSNSRAMRAALRASMESFSDFWASSDHIITQRSIFGKRFQKSRMQLSPVYVHLYYGFKR